MSTPPPTTPTPAPAGSAELRPEDEKLPVGKAFLYGFQHILSMYGGVIAIPLIIGSAAGLDPAETGMLVASALFVSGLAKADFTGASLCNTNFYGSYLNGAIFHGAVLSPIDETPAARARR